MVFAAGLRSLLGSTYTFDFVEGEKSCDAAPGKQQDDTQHEEKVKLCPGIAEVYSGPYIAFFTHPTPEQVAEAFELVNEIIDEDGPFDGIMGFSQGASLAASILLQRQLDHPSKPPQFHFAIFICGLLPFSPHTDFHKELYDGFRHQAVNSPITSLDEKVPLDRSAFNSDIEWTSAVSSAITKRPSAAVAQQVIAMFESLRGNSRQSMPTAWHPLWDDPRIDMPTAHIIGAKDSWMPQSLLLKDFCVESQSRLFDHRGGHEVPRSESVAKGIADCIVWAADKANFGT